MKKLLITIGLLITLIGCEYEEFDPTAPRESTAVKWTDGIVYYKFDASFPVSGKVSVRNCMDIYEKVSSLRFIELENTKGIKYFCTIKKGNVNQSSGMGMHKNMEVILEKYNNYEIILHELGHLIGLEHEHQREDRNNYITINWGNIIEGKEHNFSIVKHQLIPTTLFKYDERSIMHYPMYAWSNNGEMTITSNIFFIVGTLTYRFTDEDIKKIQYLHPL